MPGGRWRTLLTLVCLVMCTGWALDAAAHRRVGLPLPRPASPPATEPSTSPAPKTSGPLSLKPEAYWKRLKAQEKAGELAAARETGWALVNLFPQAPQRQAALLTLANLAKQQGEQEKAVELYAFLACLQSGTSEAARVRLTAARLELSRDLTHSDPVRALRLFLEKVATLPPGNPPETLQEPLRAGWRAVAQKVRATVSPPLSLVEEVLELWHLQPQGSESPEAALLLADILKDHGLLEEAQALLTRWGKHHTFQWQRRLKSNSLELAWLSRGWQGLTDTWHQEPSGKEEKKSLLHSWLACREAGGLSFSVGWATTAGETLLPWLLPQAANAAERKIQTPALAKAWQNSWPAPLDRCLQAALARRYLTQGDFSREAQVYQMMAEKSAGGNLTPFYQDRLGLSRLREGQLDAAQTVFHVLAQHGDLFWQRLARVRMGDLELARLQKEPSP